jgi:hypothetical protein
MRERSYGALAVIHLVIDFALVGPGSFLLLHGQKVLGGIILGAAALATLVYMRQTYGGLLAFMAGVLGALLSFLILGFAFGFPATAG